MAKKRSGGGLTQTQQAAKFLGVAALSGAVLAGIALPAFGTLGLAAKGTVKGFDDIPSNLQTPPLSQRTRILDSRGGQIATVYERDRTVVPLTKVSPYMQKAIVAIEDARFYQHGAIDLKGVLRAVNRNAQEGGAAQGASTLTQQYVKNVFVEEAGNDPTKVAEAQQKSLGRKIRELKYAIQVEEKLGKKKILENYLNITFFGEQAYGVESAAQRYFSTSAKDLTLPQAALLAGLVQSPSRYDPVNDKEEATLRRNTVLKRMADVGDITRAQAAQAQATPIKLKVTKPRSGCITAIQGAGFFCDYVRKTFLTDPAFGKTEEERQKVWATGGLTIRTTLDPRNQAASNDAATSKVNKDDKIADAVVQVQPGTGKILAMAQSRPYGLDQSRHETVLNLSVDNKMGGTFAGFQVGSTFKPITAAAALEKGISPNTVFDTDWKIGLPGSSFRTCDNAPADGGTWSVQNEMQTEKGAFDMTSALGKSINTYFATLEQKAGLCETVTMAQKVGYIRGNNKPLMFTPSTTLGGQESTPLAMASVYATFANRGTYCSPVAIEAVTARDGKAIAVPQSQCSQAMSTDTADTVNQMLKGVVEDGTGAQAGLSDRDNAGKTGTTDERKNAWFVGYTPNLSTAVWVGSDGSKQISMTDITIGDQYYDKVCGGCLPGPIWRTAMTGALGSDAPSFNFIDVPRGQTKPDDKDKNKPGDGDNKPGDGNTPDPGISIPGLTIGGSTIGGNDGGNGNGGNGNGGNRG
ncbi:transglycosylase domain-containing protein [Streptomyces beijiangensis]|uniref:Transglycosylase domain-containing protein n=1 Tax=Streptomyces beijiangensis TaxID=163361 RepID=A0A939JDW8_9ACTN|nr:transglycosylase domain-containing protein [Streptomyces beijiangensis]MBO0512461.1 transglycosylase domain-containing protein [Streptomyces beijiangensis]